MARSEEAVTKLVQETYHHCAVYLREVGIRPDSAVWRAARAVVWERYRGGEDGWDRLKEAIGQLEAIVGRPKDEGEL